LVQEMMEAQSAYFKARKEGRAGIRELETSRLLERQVRAELKKPMDNQGTLDF
jgi:uncharacterized protein (UPF0297 family)